MGFTNVPDRPAILVRVDDVVTFMLARASPDVAATLEWLAGNDFTVAKESDGSQEPFGNAVMVCRRSGLGVRITRNRGPWILDLAPPDFDFMNFNSLLAARETASPGCAP